MTAIRPHTTPAPAGRQAAPSPRGGGLRPGPGHPLPTAGSTSRARSAAGNPGGGVGEPPPRSPRPRLQQVTRAEGDRGARAPRTPPRASAGAGRDAGLSSGGPVACGLRGEPSRGRPGAAPAAVPAPRPPQPGAAGAAAEPLSPPALGVSFVPGPAGPSGFSGTRTAVVNEIRSPQITELCRTL